MQFSNPLPLCHKVWGLPLCYNRQFLQALTYKHKLVFIESVPAILIVGVNLGSDPSEKVANKDSKTFWPQSNGGNE